MKSIRLEDLTWPKVKAALASGFDTIAFAVGSTEQHGPHLPVASDTLMGEWLAETTARRLGNALVGPALRVGCSQHHLAFPGTISIEPATLRELLVSYTRTLLNNGFRRALIIPSHGGNFQMVAEAVSELRKQMSDREIVTFADLNQLIEASQKLSGEFGVTPGASGAHAGEFETSIILFLRPDLVDISRAEEGVTGDSRPLIPDLLKHGLARVSANGILGDGRLGQASRGERYLEMWVDLIMKQVNASAAA
jgi:creatinine amidohydrolase/Fe(II)-dependent formamide hydrolase-like protein